MALYIKNKTVEAAQFMGKNQDELITILGKQDSLNIGLSKGASGLETLAIFLANGGPTEVHLGQYLVREGGAIKVMSEKEFLATYDPA